MVESIPDDTVRLSAIHFIKKVAIFGSLRNMFFRMIDTNMLEVVITSVDYGDFLNQTLPFTIGQVDRVVVVTSFEDELTKQVCRKWSVECIATDIFTEDGESFNKGQGINMGMQMLRNKGWVIAMDSDIVLPITFRHMLQKTHLHPDHIYGCNRVNVVGWDAWQDLKKNWHETPQFGYHCLLTSHEDYPLGATLVHNQFGYVPIGFFQMWNSSWVKKHNLRYPDVAGSAERDDVQWGLRWPRKNRTLLPTVRVFHLESEKSEMGKNWNGRKTKPFTADGNPLVIDIPPDCYQ